MTDVFNMLYRLFAPLLVVIVIIAGVDLSSGLIKNSQEKQTAISVAHAGACAVGVTPIEPKTCPTRDKKGQCLPTKCIASANGTIVTGFWTPSECCLGNNWAGAESATAKGGQAVLNEMMKSVMEFFKPKPSTPGAPDTRPELPVCQGIAVSPTLPLVPGESATLTWTLAGGKADTIIVSPDVGAVVGFSTRVSPRISTTYTVTAINERGSAECPKVRVYVGPRDDTDEETFSDSGTYNNGDVDIWSSDTAGSDAGRDATNSAYDDIWDRDVPQGGAGQGGTNDDENYYDFLSSLAEGDSTPVTAEQSVDYGEYYYGDDDTFDWSDFGGEDASWDNIDLQEGYIGEVDGNSLNLGMREDNFDYYNEYDDGQFAQNNNGLTNEEIYGVWNRPQSPATGGLGLSGGFGGGFSSGSSNVPVDLSATEESVSIFGRIGRWFKNTFCFWCSDGGSAGIWEVDSEGQVAANFFTIFESKSKFKHRSLVDYYKGKQAKYKTSTIGVQNKKGKIFKTNIRVVDVVDDSISLEERYHDSRKVEGLYQGVDFSYKKQGIEYGITVNYQIQDKIAVPFLAIKESRDTWYKDNKVVPDHTNGATRASIGSDGAMGDSIYLICNDSLVTLFDKRVIGALPANKRSIKKSVDFLAGAKATLLTNGEYATFGNYVAFCGDVKKESKKKKFANIIQGGQCIHAGSGLQSMTEGVYKDANGQCDCRAGYQPSENKKGPLVCEKTGGASTNKPKTKCTNSTRLNVKTGKCELYGPPCAEGFIKKDNKCIDKKYNITDNAFANKKVDVDKETLKPLKSYKDPKWQDAYRPWSNGDTIHKDAGALTKAAQDEKNKWHYAEINGRRVAMLCEADRCVSRVEGREVEYMPHKKDVQKQLEYWTPESYGGKGSTKDTLSKKPNTNLRGGQGLEVRSPTPQEICAKRGRVFAEPAGRKAGCYPPRGSTQQTSAPKGPTPQERCSQRNGRLGQAEDGRTVCYISRPTQRPQARPAQPQQKPQARPAPKPPQARPAPRPAPAPRPQPVAPQNWLQQFLARLSGTEKPRCLSFTADKLSIKSGEEVTLQWTVTGADPAKTPIITPSVRFVTENGKLVAKATPLSNVQYTLIVANTAGVETRCQAPRIVVDADDATDSLVCDTAITNLSIRTDPTSITRPACDPEISGEQCDTDWAGKEIRVKWQVEPSQCVTSCKIQVRAAGEQNYVDIWTTPGDMKYDLDTQEDGYSNKGFLKETSTFKLRCEDGLGNLKEDTADALVREE